MDFRTEPLADLAARVRAKHISSRELTSHALGSHRCAEPSGQRVRRGRRGTRPRPGGRDRRAHRAGRGPGSARRHPDRRQRPRGCGGLRHDTRLAVARRRRARRERQHPRGEAEGEGLRRPRQDQHPRVRMEGRHAERGVRRDPQPVGPVEVGRRVVGRHGRRARGRDGAARDRIGRRRLDPHPVGDQRPVGPEALARSRALRRRHATGLGRALDEGPDGSADPRRRVRARVRGRPRSDRHVVAADARRALVACAERPRRAAEGRVVADARVRAGRQAGARCLRARGARARSSRHRGRRDPCRVRRGSDPPLPHDRERRHARRGRAVPRLARVRADRSRPRAVDRVGRESR